MAIAGMVLAVLGGLAMLVFSVQILVMAFKTSVLWGLASLFIPFAGLVYVIKYWDQAKTPFLRMLMCLPVYLIGLGLMMAGTTSTPTP